MQDLHRRDFILKGVRMKAMVFDVDDTLYDRGAPFRKAFEELYPGRRDVSVRELYLAVTRRGSEVFEAAQRGEMPLEESHIYRVKNGFADMGIEITEEEALQFQERYAAKQREIEMPEAIREAVEYCGKSGCLMGVLTNGPAEHQFQKVEQLGLLKWVKREHVIISGACGLMKPDVRIFKLTEKQMGLKSEDIWYVGDSYESDICGAKAAGWKVIWLNKGRKTIEKDMVYPDKMVYDEEELLICLKELLEMQR